jgi:hypothetical protein
LDSEARRHGWPYNETESERLPFWNLKVEGTALALSSSGMLFEGLCGSEACGGARAMHYRISSTTYYGRPLWASYPVTGFLRYKRHAHPAFEPTNTLHTLHTLHTRTIHPLSRTHTMCRNSLLCHLDGHGRRTATLYPNGDRIHDLSYSWTSVTTTSRLAVTARDLPLPVHDHGRCTLTFHPGQDRIHGPGCPCNSGTNSTPHHHGTDLCAASR